jgi:prophage antirepressor-like protein
MQVSTKNVVPFDFDGVPVRAILRDGQPWFVAADVCVALEYSNASKAVSDHVDEDDCSTLTNSSSRNGGGKMLIINESGLYSLILRSRKPEAKRFKRWVTSEVLPQIHRTGQYQATWFERRHAIASTSKVLSAMLHHFREAAGKVTKEHHYQNEHKLVNSLLSGEFKGMDREQMSIYDMEFLAHFEIRNAVLIGSGVEYQQRKMRLIAEAKAWKEAKKPVLDTQFTTVSLAI